MAAPGSAESGGSQDGEDEYATTMASSWSRASREASEYKSVKMETLAAIGKSREQGWSEVADHVLAGAVGLLSRGLNVEDQLLWEKLKKEAPRTFVDEVEGLKLGRLIAEGGQGKIYEALINGFEDPFVAKVFKMEGFSLVDLHHHWPQRKMPSIGSEGMNGSKHRSATTVGGLIFDPLRGSKPLLASTVGGLVFDCNHPDSIDDYPNSRDYLCPMSRGLFLEDGSFAFLSPKYWGDLRTLINLKLGENNDQGPPFSYGDVGFIIYSIAIGMKHLHKKGVLHRDLKAANVLCGESSLFLDEWRHVVADYESSMLVQGTGFWRAPEVLEDLLKKPCDRNKEIWTEKVDMYSFAMTCYEVMTGNIPFYGYVKNDWKRVIDGERPHLPDYVDPRLGELVERCWHKEPSHRPTFDAIVDSLSEIQDKIMHK